MLHHAVVFQHVHKRCLARIIEAQEQNLGVLVVQAAEAGGLGTQDTEGPNSDHKTHDERGKQLQSCDPGDNCLLPKIQCELRAGDVSTWVEQPLTQGSSAYP